MTDEESIFKAMKLACFIIIVSKPFINFVPHLAKLDQISKRYIHTYQNSQVFSLGRVRLSLIRSNLNI